MLEFAHISRPGVLQELLHGGRREAIHLLAIAAAAAVEEVLGQQGDVFAALAQSGKMDFDGVDAEEQLEQFSSHFVSLAGVCCVMVKFILDSVGNRCIRSGCEISHSHSCRRARQRSFLFRVFFRPA